MECIICTNIITDTKVVIQLDCTHHHCHQCLLRNFTLSQKSRPFLPMRCCSADPIKPSALLCLIQAGLIKRADLQLYRHRLAEYQAKTPLHCYDPKCRAFIPNALRGPRNSMCAKCHRKTCGMCKGKMHFGPCLKIQEEEVEGLKTTRESREARNIRLFMALAQELRWKRCPGCQAFVQKSSGCNHIICRCGCDFCYRCGQTPYDSHASNNRCAR